MYIKAKVHTKAKEEKVIQKSQDTFIIYVREKPKMGAANEAMLSLLAHALGVQTKKLRIVRGALSPHKLVELIHSR